MLRPYLFALLAPLSSRRYARPPMALNARPVTDQSASPHEWVARIRGGDDAAFEAMFRAHYDGLCRYVAAYLGSRDSAEDVVQGVFARIWEDRSHWVVTPDAEFDAAELRQRLERALSALPPRTRTAFVLSRHEGLSYAEAASRMAISPKTIGVHISRALTVLRKALLPS